MAVLIGLKVKRTFEQSTDINNLAKVNENQLKNTFTEQKLKISVSFKTPVCLLAMLNRAHRGIERRPGPLF